MGENGTAALALRAPSIDSRMAVAPRNLQDVQAMALAVSKSGLYGVKSVEEAQIRMVTGMELGLSMMQSLRGVFVMSANGKQQPGLYADTMVGICKSRNDVCEHFSLVESSAKSATYETQRKGDPNPVRMTFTIDQARAAGLANKDVWKAYPDAMLRARASTALARAVYPDLLNGLYSYEEISDMGSGERRSNPPPPQSIASDGEVIEQPLEGQLEESISNVQERSKLFERLMCELLDARSPEAFDVAMSSVATAKESLDKEQLGKLRKAAKEARAAIEPAA